MDTTNLKRPSHYGKMNNRSGGAGGGGQQQHHPLDFNNYASSKLACNRSDTTGTDCNSNNSRLASSTSPSHWQNPKALTHHHHQQQQQAYNSNATSGGGGGGNNIFNSGFSGLSCSTDLPPNRW
ncbi:unnamed protein product [Trichobilharzia regenti]|nr:unnamed protein product [Trichobilharzia regenti]